MVGLRLCWTVFYDDFTLISRDSLCKNAGMAAEALFDLLGFVYAKDGDKFVGFSESVKTLGLILHLGKVGRPFGVGHTESRRAELAEFLKEILENKTLEPKQAERLRGRMQWFECYAFGRIAQRSLRVVGSIALSPSKVVRLNNQQLQAIKFLLQRVCSACSISVSPRSLSTFIVFTDGACEGSDVKAGGVGGVLVDPCGRILRHFSEHVPVAYMAKLLSDSENPIYELELLPIYLAMVLWRKFFSGMQTVFYLDNDAARASLCRAQGSTDNAVLTMENIIIIEDSECLKTWYARVPTHSNIADDPSRHECKALEQMGSVRHKIDWDQLLKNLVR